MQEFTKKLAGNSFNILVILDKYFQLQKLGLLSQPGFYGFYHDLSENHPREKINL
ncbi:hypothetical protein NIES267_64150 [Calothrix parasitica NIES-267]|uniref:Uncharacterized protein n=1 Tax=Calothrix parasitica NIES-267 TaxID=1973488 RepID=A0A1Z4M078_9CYAN|nr:hypothetical protein NIES267_64150 [Calothrix parasitica NIES-267]